MAFTGVVRGQSASCSDYINALPWTYGFEDATSGSSSTPNADFGATCWTHHNNATATNAVGHPYIAGSNNPHGGTKTIYWYRTFTESYGDYQIVALPGVDPAVASVNTLELSFWVRMNYENYPGTFIVGVMTDPTDVSTFEAVGDPLQVSGTEWSEVEISLSSYTGSGQYVAIRANRVDGVFWSAYVDDITLSRIESCPAVKDLKMTACGTDEVTVTWRPKGNASSWEVSLDGVVRGTVSTPTYTFTNLTATTTYTVSVVTKCGGGEESNPTTLQVSTISEPITTLPYSCDFEGSEAMDVVMVNDGQANQWMVGSDANNTAGGANSLYIHSSDVSNTYDGSQASTVFAYIPFELQTGSYLIEFDWKCEGDWQDYLRVALVPATTTLTPGTATGWNQSLTPGITLDSGNCLVYHSDWQHHQMSFDITAAGVYKLVFFWTNNNSYSSQPPAAIDNIRLRVNTCPFDSQVFLLSSTHESATIEWTGSETTYRLEYGPVGFNPGTGTVMNVTGTSTTINGLSSSTEYDLYLSLVCAEDNVSFPVLFPFATLAGPISSFPWSCDFEGTSAEGWEFDNNLSTNHWTIGYSVYSSYGNSLYVSNDGYSNYDYDNSSTSEVYAWREMQLDEGRYQIMFQWQAYGEGSGSSNPDDYLSVWLVPEANWGTTNGELVFGPGEDQTYWGGFNGEVTVPAAGNYRLLFVWHNDDDGAGYSPAAIDDIEVVQLCPKPTNVTVGNLTSTSATLEWTGSALSYSVQYGPVTNYDYWTSDYDNFPPDTVDGTSFDLTGLVDGTQYIAGIRSLCAPGESSGIAYVTFTASSNANVMSVPYSCDFEATENPEWVFLAGTAANMWYIGDATNSTLTGSGSKALYVRKSSSDESHDYDNTSENSIFAYAQFNLDAGGYEISYDWKGYGESTYDYMRVALVPSSTSISSTVPDWSTTTTPGIALDGETILNLHTDWTTHTQNFTVETSGVYSLVFYWRNDDNTGTQPPAAIDNVSINSSSCPFGATVTASAVTTQSATVSWTGAEGSYHVEYGVTGFQQGYGTSREVNALTTDLSGLQANTGYDVYIRRICGPGDTSAAAQTSFTTLDIDPIPVPFICDFEDASAALNWRFVTNNDNQWYIGSADNNTTGGSKALYVSGDGGTTNNYNTYTYGEVYAYTRLSFNSYAQYTIRFNYRVGGNETKHYLRVGLIPAFLGFDAGGWSTTGNPPNTIVLDGSQALYNDTDWQHISRQLYLSPGDYYLVFYWRDYLNSTNAIQPGPTIDDIVIKPYTCNDLTDLAVANVTSSSATVSWSGGNAATYQVEYGPAGFTPGQGSVSTVTTSSISLSGLEGGTKYDIYVHGICSTGDESDNISTSFFTLPNPQPVPFACDFEAVDDAAKWAFSFPSSTLNDWTIGSADNNTTGGSKAMYVSNDNGGSSYAYTHLSLTPGLYTINYDWKASGNSNCAYLRVALVPTASGYNACCWSTSATPGISLDGGTVLYNGTDWTTKEIDFEVSDAGNYLLVFMWNNTCNTATNIQPAAIDNVTVQANLCPAPTNLTATPVSSTSHIIAWSGTASQYTVEYGTTATATGPYGRYGYTLDYANPGERTTLTVAGTSVTLTDLQPGMEYEFVVSALCDEITSRTASSTFTTLIKDPETVLPLTATDAGSWACWTGGSWDNDNSANTRTYHPSCYGSYDSYTRVYGECYTSLAPKNFTYSNNGVSTQGHYDLAAGSTMSSCNDDFHVGCAPTEYGLRFFATRVVRLDPGTYTLDQDYWCGVGTLRIALVPAYTNPLVKWNLVNTWTSSTVPGMPLDGGAPLATNSQWSHYNTSFTIAETGIYYLTYWWEAPSYSETSAPVGINNIVLDYVPAPDVHHIVRTVTGNGTLQLEGQTLAGGNYAAEGSEITFTATPESEAYGLQYLLVDGQPVSNPHTMTVSDDVNAEAIFIPVDRPDLHVVNITCPATVTTGQTVEVSWTVRNDGFATTPSSWTDRLYIDTDPSALNSTCVSLASESNMGALTPGGSYTRTVSVTIPGSLEGGDYYFVVTANNSNDYNTYSKVTCANGVSPEENGTAPFCTIYTQSKSFLEANEDNTYRNDNVLVKPVHVNLSLPELHITDFTYPTNLTSNQSASVSWTVTNDGTEATPSNKTWSDFLYLSSSPEITVNGTGYTLLGSWNNVRALDPGESYTREATVTIPSNYEEAYLILLSDAKYVYNVQCPDGVTAVDNTTAPYCTATSFCSNYNTSSSNDLNHVDEISEAGTEQAVNITGSSNRTWVHDNFVMRPVTIAQEYPNLHVTSLTYPENINTYQTVEISYSVSNDGIAPTTSSWTDRIFLSPDPYIDNTNASSVITLWSDTRLNALAPGESYTRTVSVTLPGGLSTGSYYLIATADASQVANVTCPDGTNVTTQSGVAPYCTALTPTTYKQLVEPSGTSTVEGFVMHDNFILRTVNVTQTFPDIHLANLSFPSGLTTYSTIDVSWTVSNDGSASTPSGWIDRLYLSPDPYIDNTNASSVISLWFGSRTIALDPGESYTRTVSVTLPGNLPTGDYYIIATADASNNFVSQAAHIDQLLPDLNVSAVTHSDLYVGHYIGISFTVSNSGAAATPQNVEWSDQIFLSTTPELTSSATLLWSGTNLRTLLTDDSYTRTVSVTLPQAGDYYLIVSTDHNNNVWEPNEVGTDNRYNLYVEAVNVSATPLPQLHPVALNCGDIYTGQLTTASFTIRNEGIVATPNGVTWTDYLYLSHTPDGREELLGSWQSVSTLDPSQEYSRDVSFTLPLTHLTGEYYLVLVSNPNADPLVFSNYYENTISIPVNVVLPPVADLQVTNIYNYPFNILSGRPLSVNYTITNVGAGPTSSNGWRDLLFISPNPDITDLATLVNEAIPLAEKNVTRSSPLPSGSSINKSFIAAYTQPELYGTFYLYVATNVDENEYEHTNYQNNVTRSTEPIEIMLGFLCDLSVYQLEANQEATHDTRLKFNFYVRNPLERHAWPCWVSEHNIRSAIDSSEFYMPRWTDKVYLSKNPDLTGVEINSEGKQLAADANNQHPLVDIANDDWYYLLKASPDNYPGIEYTAVGYYSKPCEEPESPIGCYNCAPLPIVCCRMDSNRYVSGWPKDWIGGHYEGRWPNNVYVAGAFVDPNLRNGDHYKKKYNFSYPNFLPDDGTYYIIVVADAEDDVMEFNAEDNNTASTPITLTRYSHNFTLSDLTIDRTTLVPGYGVNTNFTLHNDGGLNFNDSLDIYVYCSNSLSLDPDGYVRTTNPANETPGGPITRLCYTLKDKYSLPHNSQHELSLRIPIPDDLPDGTYSLCFVVNPTIHKQGVTRVPESSFDDNIINSHQIEICQSCPMPDLAPSNLQLFTLNQEPLNPTPGSLYAGDDIIIEFDVHNNGTQSLNGTPVYTAFYISLVGSNEWIWCPVKQQTQPTPVSLLSTPGGGSEHYVQTVTIPPMLTEGDYLYRITVDVSDNVMEANEEDNSLIILQSIHINYHPLYLAIRNNGRTPAIPSTVGASDPTTLRAGDAYRYAWIVDLAHNRPAFHRVEPYEKSDAQGDVGYSETIDWEEVPENHNAFVERVYFSTDAEISDDDIVLKTVGISQTKATTIQHTNHFYLSGAENVRIPRDIVGEGYVIIEIDANHETPDTNRANNIFAKPVTVTEAAPEEEEEDPNDNNDPYDPYNPYSSYDPSNPVTPSQPSEPDPPSDLVVTAFNVPASVHQKDVVNIEYTIMNVGENPAKGYWTDKVYNCDQEYLANSSTASYFRRAEKDHSFTLAPGESKTLTIQVVFPDSDPGNYPLTLWVDAYDDVNETDNSNNYMTVYYDLLYAPPCDLTVTDIQNPSDLTIGSTMHVEWTLKNVGYNTLSGLVHDGIYLSDNQTIGNDDYLIGELSETLSLAGDATTIRSADFSLQGVPSGSYYLIVRTNMPNAFMESDYDNNRVVSTDRVTVSLPTLTIGQEETFTLASNRSTAYRLNVSRNQAGKTLAVSMVTEAPTRSFNGLYLSHEDMPTTGHYDFGTNKPYVEQQQVVIPNAEMGTYYILVNGATLRNIDQQITLLASILEFGIISVDGNSGGNTGSFTTTVTGASFDSVMDFRLVRDGNYYPAQRVKFHDATTCYVTFNLTDLPVGSYDMEAERPGGIVTRKADAFQVIEGLPEDLRCKIYAPDEVRTDQNVEITFEYYNAGNTDVEIAGFMVVSGNNHPVRETPFTIPEIIRMNRETHDWPDTLIFLTAGPGMEPGVIRPGHGGTKRFFVFTNKLFPGDELDVKVYAIGLPKKRLLEQY